VSSTVVCVIALVASFFLTGEDAYPGLFYVQRQALWSGGTYEVKITYLLTFFTLISSVALPLVLLFGGVGLARRLMVKALAPPAGWDTLQLGRRLLMAAAALVLLAIWAAVTGVVALAPELLSPLGSLASILLLLVPALPLVPALFFEAMIPPSYVEGPIEGMQLTTYKERTTLHLYVAGHRFTMKPSLTEGLGLGQGTRVGLIVTGFFKNVRHIARVT
jgi:hypothetical protein